jgi:hypothetical protein
VACWEYTDRAPDRQPSGVGGAAVSRRGRDQLPPLSAVIVTPKAVVELDFNAQSLHPLHAIWGEPRAARCWSSSPEARHPGLVSGGLIPLQHCGHGLRLVKQPVDVLANDARTYSSFARQQLASSDCLRGLDEDAARRHPYPAHLLQCGVLHKSVHMWRSRHRILLRVPTYRPLTTRRIRSRPVDRIR